MEQVETLKKKLESGSEIEIWLANFQDGHELYMAVAKELSKYDLAEGTVENLALVITSSKEVNAVLWPCMKMATYTGNGYEMVKITPEIFQKKEVRADLAEIQKEVMGFNLSPFSKPIGSLLIAALTKSIPTLKSPST
jgi:hypothetical protein